MPSLPLSPIAPDSADHSVTATMGSSRDESIIPSEVVVIVPPVGDVCSGPMTDELQVVSAFRRGPVIGFAVGASCSVSGHSRSSCSVLFGPGSSVAAGSGRSTSGRAVAGYY